MTEMQVFVDGDSRELIEQFSCQSVRMFFVNRWSVFCARG